MKKEKQTEKRVDGQFDCPEDDYHSDVCSIVNQNGTVVFLCRKKKYFHFCLMKIQLNKN